MKPITFLSLAILLCGAWIYAQGTHRLARECLLEPDGRTAVELCKTAIASGKLAQNEHGDVAFAIGRLLHDADPEEALQYYGIAAEVYPEKTSAFHNRGMINHKMGNHLAALPDYTIAIERMEAGGREYDDVYRMRGNVYRALKMPIQALEDYDKQLAINPNHAWTYMDRAQLYRTSGQLDLAVIDSTKAVQLAPTDPFTLLEHYKVLLELEDYQGALIAMTSALKAYPDDTWRLSRKSWLEAKLKDYDAALATIDLAIAYGADDGWTWRHRAWINRRLGDRMSTYGDLVRAQEHDPEHKNLQPELEYWSTDIIAAVSAGDPAAWSAIDTLLAEYPTHAQLYHAAVTGAIKSEQYDAAISYADRLVARDPEFIKGRLMRANALLAADRHEASMADLDHMVTQLTAIDPSQMSEAQTKEYALALVLRGNANLQTGNFDQAISDARAALEINQDDHSVRAVLAQALAKNGDPRAAIDEATKGVDRIERQSNPNRSGRKSTLLLIRAHSYRALGRNLAAYEDYKSVVTNDPIQARKVKKILVDQGRLPDGPNTEVTPAFLTALRACALDPSCL